MRLIDFHDLALLVDEELGEIPGNLSSHILLFVVELAISTQELVNGVCVGPVHLNLREHGEPNSQSHSCFLNFLVGARLLVFELVAWERQNFETFVSILLVDLHHPLVVFVGKTSLCGYIDDKNGFFPLNK